MTPEEAKALREPFPDHLVGKLPRVTCGQCRNASDKVCGKHSKKKCTACGNWITEAHMHLDYVGHAETTDRLLEVDACWAWEPVAFDERGLPAFDGHGGLWIRLTVAGMTRYGYGDAQGKKSPDAVKEAIGDAIRNAAMRFGVALDLWAKSDLHADHADEELPPEAPRPSDKVPATQAKAELLQAVGGDKERARELWTAHAPTTRGDLDELLAGVS